MFDEIDRAIAAQITRLRQAHPAIGWAWSVRNGRYRVNNVQFPAGKRGNSVVTPLTDWMETRQEILTWLEGQLLDVFERGGCARTHQGGNVYAYSFALSNGWSLLLAADDGGFPVEREPVAVCLQAPDHMTDYTRVCPDGAAALAFATEVAAKGAPYALSFPSAGE